MSTLAEPRQDDLLWSSGPRGAVSRLAWGASIGHPIPDEQVLRGVYGINGEAARPYLRPWGRKVTILASTTTGQHDSVAGQMTQGDLVIEAISRHNELLTAPRRRKSALDKLRLTESHLRQIERARAAHAQRHDRLRFERFQVLTEWRGHVLTVGDDHLEALLTSPVTKGAPANRGWCSLWA